VARGRPRRPRSQHLKGTIEDYHDILEDHQEVGVAFITFIADVITKLRIKAARANENAETS